MSEVVTMFLQRDRRWDSMRIQSTDDFKPILENIRFVKGVSEDVKNRSD